ncbi:MAG: SufS family cysteine desulfurase [Lachnospiraceae bacterium]|nr:SufS family cysteine desulfurase [Lachnospiraceae bacterium]
MNDHPYKKDFPIFEYSPCVYLDSAATAQKPSKVIEAEREFLERLNANPLRGLYDLSMRATDAYEASREAVASFINAELPQEIIFTRNATESLNLIAYSYGLNFLKEGDEIVCSVMEHHSNMLPWQMVSKKTGAVLKYLEPLKDGTITDEEIGKKITDKTKLVAIAQVSNVLGVTNPIERIAKAAHEKGALIAVDGAQSVPHMKVDVKELNIDFLSFSGHKMMAPMGIGVLYARKELLEKMPPFLTGGEMIESVSLDHVTYADIPHKFEAGTVNAQGAYGLKAAIEYINTIGFDEIRNTEDHLTEMIFDGFDKLPCVHIQGSKDPLKHNGIVSFTIDDVHPHDIASILDADKVDIRAGHHCAEPLMKYLGVQSTARASLYLYNDEEDVRIFLEKVKNIRRWLGLES